MIPSFLKLLGSILLRSMSKVKPMHSRPIIGFEKYVRSE